MKLKNWEKITGGRAGLIMICALAVLSLILILEHILNLGQLLGGSNKFNMIWGELIIDLVSIFSIGIISLSLVRAAESKRSKTERTLSYSEERYKELFENSPLGIYRTTPDGQILLANSALIHMLGYSSFKELAKRNLEKEGFEPDYPRSQFKEIMEKEGEVKGLESAWLRRDRTATFVCENAKAIRDEKGKILYYEGTVEDITEKKKAEERLKQSEKEYRGLFEGAHDAIIIFKPEREIVLDVNQRACEVYGFNHSEFIGMSLERISRDVPRCKREIKTVLDKGVYHHFETVQYRKDRTEMFLEINASVVDFKGQPAILSINRDVTKRQKAEVALRASEQRYKLLFEKNLAGVYHTTLDGKMLNCNESFARLLGYDSAEEVMTHRALEFYFKDAERKEFLALLLRKGNLNDFEICMRRRDGKPVWILENVTLIKDEKSEQVSIQGTSIDITERKKAQEALRENEERLKLVLEGAELGTWDQDMKTGEVVRNRRWVEMLGYTLEEIDSRADAWKELIHPDDLPIVNRIVEDHEAGRTPFLRCEHRMKTKSGEWKWILNCGKIIQWDSDGKPVRATGTHTDITERKRVEEELRVSEEKHRLVLDNIPVLIAAIDQTGKFVLWNRYAKKMLGYSPQEAIWKIIPLDIHETKADADEVIRVASERGIYDKEIRFRCKDKTLIPVHLVVVPNKDSTGKIVGFYGFAEDITERKRAETALRESGERFRQFAENIDQVFWLTDWDAKKLLYVNPAYERLYGRSCQSAYEDRKSWQDVIHPEDRTRISESFARSADLGQYVEAEYRILRDDGTLRWVLDRNYPIRDKYGRIYRFASVADDITERKKAEDALKESEEKYRAIIEAVGRAGEGIIIIQDNEQGEAAFVFVNDQFCQMSDYSQEELMGRSPWDFVPHEVSVRLKDWYKRRHTGESLPGHYEAAGIRKDGAIVPLDLSIVTMPWQGNIATVLYLRDITERKKAEEALRESEEKHRTYVENAPDGIFIVDSEARYVDVNEAACRMTGYSRDKLLNMTIMQLAPSDTPPEVFETFEKLKRNGKTSSGIVIQRKDGSVIHASLDAVALSDGRYMAFCSDVTRRKKAEEALKTSQAQLSNAVKIAKLGYWEYDVVKDLFTFDDHFYAIFRTTAEKVGGYKMSSARYAELFVHPDDRPLVGIEIRKALETNDPHFSRQLEHRIIYADGEIGYITVRFFIIKDDKGKTIKTYGANQDITERKRAEEELRESEQKYRGVVDNIGIGVSLISPKMEILFLNKQMKIWFSNVDISKEAVCYRAFNNPPREEICSYCPTCKTLNDGQVHESVTDIPTGERIVNYRLISSPIKDMDGKVISAIEMVEDITERKKLQEQLIQTEKLAAVGTLAYGIAHEFNNILAGMLANAELGLVTDEPRQIKECFEIIADNSHRAASITNNLLAFARQKEARKELIDITEPLRSVLAVTRRDLEKLNIEIEEKVKPIPKIYCDAGQLSEVFLNMVTNARDAMHPKGGTLTIQVEPDQDNIRIIFKDTGCGIPEEIRGKIFEPFVTTKGVLGGSEVPGTGLGLFLTYGIINGYQGKIEVESKVGKGTQFIISIPVSKNLPPQPVQEIKNEPFGEIERKLKILLVDNEETIVSGLKKFLESRGHQVTSSLRGKKGLRLFKKDKFDLVLSDITMPDMDGIELIKKIREQDQEIKIIVITGHIMQVKENEAWKAGADEFLIKPFKNEVLCLAISKLMTEI